MSDVVEGTIGTWSYCGRYESHLSHTYDIFMMEGPYYGVLCRGASKEEIDKYLKENPDE